VSRGGIEPPTFRFSGLSTMYERRCRAGLRGVLDCPGAPVYGHVGVTAGVVAAPDRGLLAFCPYV